MDQIKLPSPFQVGESVGLQNLIDLLERARDGKTTRVSFMNGKVKYDLQIPIREGTHLDGPVTGYFRIANVEGRFLNTPLENGFHYNSTRDQSLREHQQICNEGQIFDDRTEWERVIDELINRVDPNTTDGSKILSHLKRERTKPELD
jgi:hypothetical protein